MIQSVLYLSVSNGLMTKKRSLLLDLACFSCKTIKMQLFFSFVCVLQKGGQSFLAETKETRDGNHSMSQHMHIL